MTLSPDMNSINLSGESKEDFAQAMLLLSVRL